MNFPKILTTTVVTFFILVTSLFIWRQPVYGQLTNSLKVSSNGRFLEQSNGQPFFYLADTAWAMFKELSTADIDYYLQNRHDKKFTVIQTVATWSTSEAFTNGNINKPKNQYWNLVDYAIDKAESLNLYVALLPNWGSLVTSGEINASNAEAYGKFLGNRYKSKKIIWVLGGDQNSSGYEFVWNSLAKGIAKGVAGTEDYSKVLMTFHPYGGLSSSVWFQNSPWLDFNMIQSGHLMGSLPAYAMSSDYNLSPAKPVVNVESQYENIPSGLVAGNPKLNAYDVRKSAYESVFAGGLGHSYGANEVYMFWDPGENGWGAETWGADTPWRQALEFPGAQQMQYLRALLESRYFTTRIPDQTVVAANVGSDSSRIISSRDSGGRYTLSYVPDGHGFTVNTAKIYGSVFQAWWYNPRTGTSTNIGQFSNTGLMDFTPPSLGEDWVLVLDDAAQGFSAPGIGVATLPPPVNPPPSTESTSTPIAYWNFNEGSGTTTSDVTGNGNTATLNGSSWTSGKYGGALSFDGLDDYMDVGDQNALEGMNKLSVSLWVHFNSLPVGNPYTLIGKESVYRFVVNTGGSINFVVATQNNPWYSNNTFTISESGSVTTNGWYHLVGVYDGSRVKFYINGNLINVSPSQISGSLVTNSLPFTMANQMASNTVFSPVVIDDVRVYNTALTDSNILWLYTH